MQTREIVLDTETTGLSPLTGDRVVELGCVELINHVPTGRTLHRYVNPERSMPDEAFRVHGLSEEFLADKPVFAAVADEFIDFIGDATLIAHNAPFDMGFLNAEFERIGFARLANVVIDTVDVARERHPGARVSLDALCKHYGIDNSRRTVHGALLDSQILAEVYLELIGGRQVALALGADARAAARGGVVTPRQHPPRPFPLPPRLTEADLAAHRALIASIKDPVWAHYAALEVELA